MTIRAGLQVLLGIAYPAIVFIALGRFSPRSIAFLVVAVAVLRILLARRGRSLRDGLEMVRSAAREFWLPVAAIAVVVSATAAWNDPLGLLLVPALISLSLLATFALSLKSERSMIERFARMQVDTLSLEEQHYCRRVTVVWCGFLAANGAIIVALALMRPIEEWTLYTGLLSYLLIGALFAAEYVYRHWRFRRYVGGFADPILIRLFPPDPEFAEAVVEPAVSARRADDQGCRIEMRVPPNLACWPGHFEDRSILPGVMQIDWAMRAAVEWKSADAQLRGIERLKFEQPVFPGDRLDLELIDDTEQDGMRFSYSRNQTRVSSGRLLFGDEGARASLSSTDFPAPKPPAGAWPDMGVVVPHRGSMRWLEQVLWHDTNVTCCSASVANLGPFLNPDGEAGAWVSLEWMAQCVAAHDGIERHAQGDAPRLGLLVAARRARFGVPTYRAGETYRIRATHVWGGRGGMSSFECLVEDCLRSVVVAEARLTCFVPDAEEAANLFA